MALGVSIVIRQGCMVGGVQNSEENGFSTKTLYSPTDTLSLRRHRHFQICNESKMLPYIGTLQMLPFHSKLLEDVLLPQNGIRSRKGKTWVPGEKI